MSNFRKLRGCPSPDTLLNTGAGRITGDVGLRIARHLAVCDFCAAEYEFYIHFPPGPIEESIPEKLPEPLRDLAEAFLLPSTEHLDRLELLLGFAYERRSGHDRRALSRSG